MRVLLICAAYPPTGKGGAPISSELLARGLAERGHSVRVITVADDESLQIRNGIEVKTLSSLNLFWDLAKPVPLASRIAWQALENFNPRALVRMRREIQQHKPDIVVTISIENVNVASWLAAHLEKIPVAHVMYSYFLMCWRGSMFRDGVNCTSRCPKCLIFSSGRKFMSRYVDGVTAESRAVIDRHLSSGYFNHAVKAVIPGALETLPDTAPSRPQRESLIVGYIGRQLPEKGVETIAHAARALATSAPVEFLIAGEGEPAYVRHLKSLFPASGVRFKGWMNPADFFAEVDITIVPSVYAEPFGRVSVESQAYGVPTLVARSGGLPSNIIEGKTGYSFDPDDYNALAQLIGKLAANRDSLQLMSAAARDHARRYCLATVAEEFEHFLVETQRHAQMTRGISMRAGRGFA